MQAPSSSSPAACSPSSSSRQHHPSSNSAEPSSNSSGTNSSVPAAAAVAAQQPAAISNFLQSSTRANLEARDVKMEGLTGNLRCLKVESHGKDLSRTYMAELPLTTYTAGTVHAWGEAQAPWNDLQN